MVVLLSGTTHPRPPAGGREGDQSPGISDTRRISAAASLSATLAAACRIEDAQLATFFSPPSKLAEAGNHFSP